MARPRRRKVNRDEWGSITRTEDARGGCATGARTGTWRAPTPADSPLLADYVAVWLQRAELAEDLSPRTVALYRRMFDRLVLPDVGGVELGRVPVGRLTRETVMAWELAARARSRARATRHGEEMNGAADSRRHTGTRPGPGPGRSG